MAHHRCLVQMPPVPPPCAKCKTTSPAVGDSWCTGCTAWEFLGRELSGSWDSSGARLLANDLLVSTARQVKALRSLSAGLVRDAEHSRPAGSSRASLSVEVAAPEDKRESLPRRRSGAPPPPAPKEEEESVEERGESEEDESPLPPSPTLRPLSGGDRRPPEPDESAGHRREEKRRRPHERSSRHGDRSGHSHSDHKRVRRSGHRGGRKHQRLHRLATDPGLVVHRKPSAAFWELQSQRADALDFGQLGR